MTRLSYRDIRKAFETRAALEGAAARLATERASPQAITELSAEFNAQTIDVNDDRAQSLKQMRELNSLVHGTLHRLADNQLIEQTLQSIDNRIRRAIVEFIDDDYDRYVLSYEQHVEIVDAFCNGDPRACELAVRAHVSSVAAHILERYR